MVASHRRECHESGHRFEREITMSSRLVSDCVLLSPFDHGADHRSRLAGTAIETRHGIGMYDQ